MKKVILFIIVLLAILIGLLWISKASITAHLISKEFGVPVSIETMSYSNGKLDALNIVVSNPKGSKTPTALKVSSIDVTSTWKDIIGKRLIVEEINMNDIIIGFELYNTAGSDNNWSKILSTNGDKDKPSQRKYLIKTLRLNNLNVVLTDVNDQVKNYGPIDFEFTNISDESGFPIRDIEKAIMQKIINEIIKQYALPALIKNLKPSSILPKVFPSFTPSDTTTTSPANGN